MNQSRSNFEKKEPQRNLAKILSLTFKIIDGWHLEQFPIIWRSLKNNICRVNLLKLDGQAHLVSSKNKTSNETNQISCQNRKRLILRLIKKAINFIPC